MDLQHIIRNRRSIYPDFFDDREVSKSDIEKILEAACCAPSHKKTNPWRFKVLQNTAKDRLGIFLANCYKESVEESKFSQFKFDKIQKKTTNSGAIIVICMQRDIKARVPEWEEIASTSMAVQNMWLTVNDLGIGGYWSSPSSIGKMNDFLDLKSGEKCLGFFYLGHYNQNLHPESPNIEVSAYSEWIED